MLTLRRMLPESLRRSLDSQYYVRLPATHSPNSRHHPRQRILLSACKWILPIALLALLLPLLFWEPHVEFSFYSRSWIQQEVEKVEPLSGCFDPYTVSPSYNLTRYVYGPKRAEVHPGMPLRMGMDCYNFAGTIKPSNVTSEWQMPGERTHYHSYWRYDLAPFAERQEWMLKSFFATQNIQTSRLILWSNGDLSNNSVLQKWLSRYPDAFTLKQVDFEELSKGTALEGNELLKVKDKKAWIDGDLVRLLVMWMYGGVWVDMDSLMTRDLEPLFEHEFVTQWDCYDKLYVPFNGALMHFRQHSPYLCEAFHIMATSAPPRPGTTDWGATLYLKLWRRLNSANVPPFAVLPWCFTDGRSCRLDNRLPDPFTPDPSNGKWTLGHSMKEGEGLDKVLGQIFSIHLHNQWDKLYPKGGWVERLLLRRFDQKLE